VKNLKFQFYKLVQGHTRQGSLAKLPFLTGKL